MQLQACKWALLGYIKVMLLKKFSSIYFLTAPLAGKSLILSSIDWTLRKTLHLLFIVVWTKNSISPYIGQHRQLIHRPTRVTCEIHVCTSTYVKNSKPHILANVVQAHHQIYLSGCFLVCIIPWISIYDHVSCMPFFFGREENLYPYVAQWA